MLPKRVANSTFANIERAGEAVRRGGAASDGKTETTVFGGLVQNAVSTLSAEGLSCPSGGAPGDVFLELKETGSVGGKVGSSSSCFNFARSKCCSTTNPLSRRPDGALCIGWRVPRARYETRSETPAFQGNGPHACAGRQRWGDPRSEGARLGKACRNASSSP